MSLYIPGPTPLVTTTAAGLVEAFTSVAGKIYSDRGWLSTFAADASGNVTFSGRWINSRNAAASEPPSSIAGTWFTGGTTTTTKPQFLIEPAGTTSTAWNTFGTGFGVNAPSGFLGNLAWLGKNGSPCFVVTHNGFLGIGTASPADSIQISRAANHGITLTRTTTNPGSAFFTVASFGALVVGADNTVEFTSTSSSSAVYHSFGFGNNNFKYVFRNNNVFCLGGNLTIASPEDYVIAAVGGAGSNIAGGALTIRGGISTGSAAGGALVFQTTPSGSAGSTANTSTERLRITPGGLLQIAEASNFETGTTTGTKIGTGTTQKLSFWNATPVVQPTAVADATDAASVIAQLNALLSRLRTIGIIAT